MYEIDKRIELLKDELEALRKCCRRICEIHSYQEYGDSNYDKCWEAAKKKYRYIDKNSWSESQGILNLYKAHANYWMGAAYAEKGDFDMSLRYLAQAQDLIERQSDQYSQAQVYANTCIYMAKCYIEKHTDSRIIDECHDKAENTLTKCSGDGGNLTVALWHQKANIELKLQRAIAEMDVYGQRQGFDAGMTWRYLCEAEADMSTLPFDEAAICDETVICDEDDRHKYNQWKIKQEATLHTTKGEFFKKLFFRLQECQDFVPVALEGLAEEIRCRLQRLDAASHSEEEVFFAELGQELEEIKCRFRQEACLSENTEKALMRICLAVTLSIFAREIQQSEDNTICMGNMASLLYYYSSDDSSERMVKELLLIYFGEKGPIQIKPEQSVKKTAKEQLNKILEIDPTNMYALNIKAAITTEFSVSSDVSHYPALRQSSLKRRLEIIHSEIGRDYPKTCELLNRYLIVLHNKVMEFLNSAIIDFSSEKMEGVNLQIGHYTRLQTIPKLINREGDSKLRIYNVHHLNDPLEGVLFIDRLRKMTAQGTGDLIQRLMRLYDSEKNGAVRNSVYMGSFTSRLDQLNMWSMYGDNGNGCYLQVDAKVFFDNRARISLAEMSTNDSPGHYRMDDIKYPLYMVIYLPENSGDDLEKKAQYAERLAEADGEESFWWAGQADLIRKYMSLNETVKELLIKIEKTFMKLEEDARIKIQDELCSQLMAILDLVRFLVKSETYQDEREYRIIQYSSDPEYDIDEAGLPKLYINVQKELVYEKICFGPLVQNFDSVAAYILNIKKEGKEGERRENWKIEVCKSGISYR